MKIQCKVSIINRQHLNLNINTKSKQIKSTLAIGKDPCGVNQYFILLFNSANKTGTKYKICNMKKVFAKCLNEGKVTLRFDEPQHDLSIECEVVQLSCFMKLLKSCITGDKKSKPIASLTSLCDMPKNNAPKKLVIQDRSEIPVKGFPRTLESLIMNGMQLCNFRRDILFLKNLTILDLSNNEIEKIPADLGKLTNLSELYLSCNKLGIHENFDWKWLITPQLEKSLKLLDIRNNSLQYLPKHLWKLKNLVTLKADNNSIKTLPMNIGKIKTLKYLTISRNDLHTLPGSLLLCRLQSIDISWNHFDQISPSSTSIEPKLNNESLTLIAGNAVLKYNIPYAPDTIPWTLVHDLDNACICLCGNPALDSLPINKNFDIKEHFRQVVLSQNDSQSVVFTCFLCSWKCRRKYASYSCRKL